MRLLYYYYSMIRKYIREFDDVAFLEKAAMSANSPATLFETVKIILKSF